MAREHNYRKKVSFEGWAVKEEDCRCVAERVTNEGGTGSTQK